MELVVGKVYLLKSKKQLRRMGWEPMVRRDGWRKEETLISPDNTRSMNKTVFDTLGKKVVLLHTYIDNETEKGRAMCTVITEQAHNQGLHNDRILSGMFRFNVYADMLTTPEEALKDIIDKL